MLLKVILGLIGSRPAPAKKRKSKVKRRKPRTEKWKFIGYSYCYGMIEEENLDEVPEWLKEEWNEIRHTTKTQDGKWRILKDIDDPEPNSFNDGYPCVGYFRNGKKYRYLVVAWEGMQGSSGTSFYRKHKASK